MTTARSASEHSPACQAATTGTLYGIGVGPGNPEWLTLQAARLLAACRHVCVPKARASAESVALAIARPHLRADAVVHEITFPMSDDAAVLHKSWNDAAQEIHHILAAGQDCGFLTLGDAQLYSTYIYLLDALRQLAPRLRVVTVPGITAFSAVAALTNFPVGRGKETVTIVPAGDDWTAFRKALDNGGTVVLMKVGKRLEKVLDELEKWHLLDQAVFVAHAGMPNQHVETDLTKLRGAVQEAGYLSTLIIHAGPAKGAYA